MDVQFRKLQPEHAQDYVRFFDETPHDDDVLEHKCYCVCWCSDDHRLPVDHSTREARRALAAEYVKNGTLQGYLAYSGGKVVGWCNANDKANCLNCVGWLRNMGGVNEAETAPGLRTKSIFCFTIAPAWKRRGIASRLLERVCADAAREGCDFVEAYPEKNPADISRSFVGPAELYERNGFAVWQDVKNRYLDIRVMRRQYLRGHLSYGVSPAYAGHNYARKACLLLRPFARKHGVTRLFIGADRDNIASRRTIEKLGATPVTAKDVPDAEVLHQLEQEGTEMFVWNIE